jgi:hypothetical protein
MQYYRSNKILDMRPKLRLDLSLTFLHSSTEFVAKKSSTFRSFNSSFTSRRYFSGIPHNSGTIVFGTLSNAIEIYKCIITNLDFLMQKILRKTTVEKTCNFKVMALVSSMFQTPIRLKNYW